MSLSLYVHAKRNAIPFGLWMLNPENIDGLKVFCSIYIPPFASNNEYDLLFNDKMVAPIGGGVRSNEDEHLLRRFDFDESVWRHLLRTYPWPEDTEVTIKLVNRCGNSPLFANYWNAHANTKPRQADNMFRTTRNEDPFLFAYKGGSEAYRLHHIFARSSTQQEIATGRILDWGCGAGRVSMPMENYFDKSRIYGADVDPVNVKWCQDNISSDRYMLCGIHPELPYAADTFSYLYGLSVMTHLDREMQSEWIRELHRVTRHGAIIVLTFHSDSMFFMKVNDYGKYNDYVSAGCWDYGASEDLREGLTKNMAYNFYRNTFNTHESIWELVKEQFQLIAIYPGQHDSFHDYVVLRTRK